MHLAGDADVEGPVERLPLDDLDGRPRRDPALAQEPEHGGVAPGAAVEVVERQPFDGPLYVRVTGEVHVLGAVLARAMRIAA